ncbi:MAG: cytochrome P450 [Dehalococcoidia bacterium]|nr:cytochrome P450 [Dehalococcoidia bacterium]MCH2503014.1 cytochrome P450 [Dehalococcoidia bacterium]MCS5669104.1 cytochrome P450 [Dehalococcoidia bacterium]
MGATLARVEGQEVFRALAERYPNLELKNLEMEYREGIVFRLIMEMLTSLN